MHALAFLAQKERYEDLSTLFSSSARSAVLRVLMLDPTRAYYQRQLEAATGLPIRAIQRELKRLTDVGLLKRTPVGNRAYFRVDQGFRMFPELRAMILKAASRQDVLRGLAAVEPAICLAFLHPGCDRALLVTTGDTHPAISAPAGILIEHMNSETFLRALKAGDAALANYLHTGVDLLGRRDDDIWRHIEAAGYTVQKGDGVP